MLFHLRDQRIVDAVGVNSLRDSGVAQRLIESERTVSVEQLASLDFNLQTLLSGQPM